MISKPASFDWKRVSFKTPTATPNQNKIILLYLPCGVLQYKIAKKGRRNAAFRVPLSFVAKTWRKPVVGRVVTLLYYKLLEYSAQVNPIKLSGCYMYHLC